MIYLDWAATTPLSREAYDAMSKLLIPGIEGLEQGNANANSLYDCGRTAFKALENARVELAFCLDARGHEVFFTSGATESDNAALFGIVEGCLQARKKKPSAEKYQVVISAIEHDAILKTERGLKQQGIEVVKVFPNKAGHIEVEALKKVLTEHTLLVSIMAVNNEIGSVMDIKSLAKAAHEKGALFHTDATQAFGKIPVSVKEWGVDALSLSSHKVGGPKGVGALYLRARTPFKPLLVGGGQELGMRSGTQNVPGIVGFAAAAKHSVEVLEAQAARLRELRDYCYRELTSLEGVVPTVEIEAGSKDYAPHVVNVMVKGFESETLILRLSSEGICISGGSACSTGSLDPSHVLSALTIQKKLALGSVRVSMGELTTKEDIDTFLDSFKRAISY
ncbi:MAG: cysteine desulfurase family protein [Anaerotardibacter sp.]